MKILNKQARAKLYFAHDCGIFNKNKLKMGKPSKPDITYQETTQTAYRRTLSWEYS